VSSVQSQLSIPLLVWLLSGVFYWWGETESLGTAAPTGLLYQPQTIGDSDCGEIGGMKIGRRKPAPAPLCPPQIPHD
jgi:hypothetical protein